MFLARIAVPMRLSCNRLCVPVVFSSTSATSTTTESAASEVVFDLDDFVDNVATTSPTAKATTFAGMLRQSKLVQLGDINGRVVVGNIVHRVGDDVYIDVGLKLNTVCKVPAVNSEQYAVGSQVLLRLHDYELSERFLGSKKDLTLLEADATLLRLLRGRQSRPHSKKSTETQKTSESESPDNARVANE